MTVTVYRSTDASAPTLTGQAGSLTTLLDALLVNGYGAKASQGWSIAFTAANTRDYLMPVGSNQRYLDVIDIGTTSAAYGRIAGYEAMTAINTGTNAFPTAAQFAGGLYVHKSATADATARPWFAYGNGKFFMLFVATDSSLSNPAMHGFMFGDFTSYVPADTFNTIIVGGTTTTAGATATNNHMFTGSSGVNAANVVGHYICRAYTGIGGSVVASKFTNIVLAGVTSANGAVMPIGGSLGYSGTATGTPLGYPNGADTGLYMERLWLTESASVRGELPGFWAPLHSVPLTHLDSFTGTGALAGKGFDVLRCSAASTLHEAFVENSNTW